MPREEHGATDYLVENTLTQPWRRVTRKQTQPTRAGGITSTHTQSNDGARSAAHSEQTRSKRPPPFVELEKEKVELATAIGYISDDNATIKLDGAAETRT